MTAIVVGLAPTPEGMAALEYAIDDARRRDAELILVEYVRVPDEGDQIERLRAARERLEAVRARVAAQGVACDVRAPIGVSSVASELVRVAEDEGAALIVIGIRHRSPVGKLILGSDARDILLKAECPVVAVKSGGR
jgi:nucleotide-binding universal stress UspA family protein